MPKSRKPMEWETQRISLTPILESPIRGQTHSQPDIPPPPPWFHKPHSEGVADSTSESNKLPLSPTCIRDVKTDRWLLIASIFILAAVVASRPLAPPTAASLDRSESLPSLNARNDRSSADTHLNPLEFASSRSANSDSQHLRTALTANVQREPARLPHATTESLVPNRTGRSAEFITASDVTDSTEDLTIRVVSASQPDDSIAVCDTALTVDSPPVRSRELLPAVGVTRGTRPVSRSWSSGLCTSEMFASTVQQTEQGKSYGTRIHWIEDIETANAIASQQKRPVFEMHVSGNFAKEAFT